MSSVFELDDGRRLALDEHGHLADRSQWERKVAVQMAAADGVELTDAHHCVIDITRAYYEEYGIEVPMRFLVRRLRDSGFGNCAASLELYRMFPEGPVRQASRYGGLPIPVSCI